MYFQSDMEQDQSAFMLRDSYGIPGVSAEDAAGLISKLLDAHPILRARVYDGPEGPVFLFDAEPEVAADPPAGSSERPFRKDVSLCRFAVFPGDRIVGTYHHMIFDASSRLAVKSTLALLMDGEDVPPETGYLADA